NADGTVTMTFNQADPTIRAHLAANSRFVLINDPATIDADGVFRITNVTETTGKVAITYFTASAPTSTSVVHWTISGQGALTLGLDVFGSATGAYTNIVAENFWVADSIGGADSGTGVEVDSAGSAGVSFTGLFLFDNFLGFDHRGGKLTIND